MCKSAFDFRGASGSFSVPREREYMVRGYYASGIGKLLLIVEIGWDGYVTDHHIATAICGISMEAAATQPSAE